VVKINNKKDKNQYIEIILGINIRYALFIFFYGIFIGLLGSFATLEINGISGFALAPSWCYEFNETICPSVDECNEYCFWKYAEEQNTTIWCKDSSYCGQFTVCPERMGCYNGVRNCRQYLFEVCMQ